MIRRDVRAAAKGAALMLALWALFVLSAMVISWAGEINTQLVVSGGANRILEAEALACSGAEIALHPAIKPGSPNLSGKFRDRQTFVAKITGEGGRLNINWLVVGENAARLEILRHYLEVKGVDLNERDRMIDCLLDWVDADNLVRLNGAEASDDYRPANSLLTRVEELKRIKGWADFTERSDWEDEFTVNSTGPVDLVWASRNVLLALPGMNEQLVDAFIKYRSGPDGVEGTEDDPKMKTVQDARTAFGLTEEQFKAIAPLVSFKDQVLRIVSVGKSGDISRTVQMVFRRAGAVPQLITWKEL